MILYLVYVEGHRLKSNLEACTSVWASVVISIPDCLRLMYLGYLNKYVCLRLRPKKKICGVGATVQEMLTHSEKLEKL